MLTMRMDKLIYSLMILFLSKVSVIKSAAVNGVDEKCLSTIVKLQHSITYRYGTTSKCKISGWRIKPSMPLNVKEIKFEFQMIVLNEEAPRCSEVTKLEVFHYNRATKKWQLVNKEAIYCKAQQENVMVTTTKVDAMIKLTVVKENPNIGFRVKVTVKPKIVMIKPMRSVMASYMSAKMPYASMSKMQHYMGGKKMKTTMHKKAYMHSTMMYMGMYSMMPMKSMMSKGMYSMMPMKSMMPKGTKKPTTKPKPKAKPPTKSERTKEKQQQKQAVAASKNLAVKKALNDIENATSQELVTALKKAETAVKKDKSISEYRLQSIAATLFKTAAKSKKMSITADVIKGMGVLVLKLPFKDYQMLDFMGIVEVLKIGKEAFMMKKQMMLDMSRQRVIFDRFMRVLPRSSRNASMAELLISVKDAAINHKAVDTMPMVMLKQIVGFLGKMRLNCRGSPPRVIKAFFKMMKIKEISKSNLRNLGNAICYLTAQQIVMFPKRLIMEKRDVTFMCRPDWPQSKIEGITMLAKNVAKFKEMAMYDCDMIKSFANCWKGVRTKDFRLLNITLKDVNCFKPEWLPTRLKDTLNNKIKMMAGSFKNLDRQQVREVVKAVGVNVKQLKELKKADLKNVSALIEKQLMTGANRMVKKAAAELILSVSVENADFKFSEFPLTFAAEVPMSSVLSLDIEKLGFSMNDSVSQSSAAEDEDNDNEDVGIDEATGTVVLEKVEKAYGGIDENPEYWMKMIKKFKPYACGFINKIFKKVPDDKVNDFISELKGQCGRCQLFEQESEAITDADLNVLGKCLTGFEIGFISKMSDDMDVRKTGIQYLRSACKAKGMDMKMMQKFASVALAMLKITSGKMVTSDTLDTLGCLAAYIKADVWAMVDKEVIIDQSEALGQYKWSRDIRNTFLKKIVNFYMNMTQNYTNKMEMTKMTLSKLTADQLGMYLPLVFPVLVESIIESLPPSVLRANLYVASKLEVPSNLALTYLQRAQTTAAAQPRKRRAAMPSQDLSNVTAGGIISMGTLMYGLTVDDIMTINDDVFKEVLDVIGRLTGFKKEQSQAWVAVLKRAYGSLSSLMDVDLKRMKNLILGMSPADIGQLMLTNVEVISEFSGIVGYSNDQTMAFYNEVKEDLNRTSVMQLTGEELSALRSFLTAASPAEMERISAMKYKTAAKDLGNVDGWSKEQMGALKKVAVDAFGMVKNWTSPIVRDIGAAIGGCTAAEINSILPSIFSVVKAVAIKQIPTSLFMELSVDHIRSMLPEQFAAVTMAQINSLPAEKRMAFNNASRINQTADTSELLENENNPSGAQSSSTVMPMIMATMMTPRYGMSSSSSMMSSPLMMSSRMSMSSSMYRYSTSMKYTSIVATPSYMPHNIFASVGSGLACCQLPFNRSLIRSFNPSLIPSEYMHCYYDWGMDMRCSAPRQLLSPIMLVLCLLGLIIHFDILK